eukprot:CAMPEP_0198137660 /NCGR_PEP_ID=MMETSP1443-20131203/1139_1 /TAXON_ID=186043 /ORGANISM="Entomoneis sp., Strain CCMP2396" /LENGTH=200 /DNA_ID=CAMNT_0043799169 /DNA_START=82 /DNA_END=684 /DNA_ORIENTATION=+
MNFPSAVLLVLSVAVQQAFVVDAFVTPRSSAHHAMPSSPFFAPAQRLQSECRAVSPVQAYQHVSTVVVPSFLPSFLTAEDIPGDVQLENIPDAFMDQVDLLNDPLLRNMVAVFGIVILILVGVNALLAQMDSAIANVLVDFEKTMRATYPSRWYELEEEAGLEDLDQIQRSVKLIAIMERLQVEEPEFMTKLTSKMAEKS